MTKATFYHAGCPVCVDAERQIAQALDPTRFRVEIVHLGTSKQRVAEAELAGRVRDLLLRDLSPEDRTIVESCILDDTDSKEVGLRIGISGPAVRKRLERMRPGLRDRLLDLAKRNLAPRDWDLVSALFVERLTPDRCGERFGIPVDRLEAELEDLIQRRIGPALGVLGQLALLRLLGRTRDDTD